MTQGVVLIARNNAQVDYIKQAAYNAKRIKKYLNLPVSVITDNSLHVKKIYSNVFDSIIEVPKENSFTYRKYNDGIFYKKTLEFKNTDRACVYDLTPYEETLLLDTDYIISNDIFINCFKQNHDFLIYKSGIELSNWRDLSEFDYVASVGPKFYWATAIFFRKTNTNKIFFDLVKHIQENWSYYQNLYQISSSVLRNDYIFSIAIHTMNGFQNNNNFAKSMPGKLFYSTDRDILLELNEDNFLFLLEKQYDYGNYTALRIKNCNIHVMNKFSLNRVIDNDN